MDKHFHIRQGLRSELRCSFSYHGEGRLEEGTVWDLSESGWRATGHDGLAPGTEMTVYVALPGKEGSKYLTIDAAVVRWANGKEAGWEITKINAASRAHIQDFLDRTGATSGREDNCHALVAFDDWKN